MIMTTNASHLAPTDIEHLKLIYQAYDRIYDIASHRWHAIKYYDIADRTSDLFGHYVRTLPRFEHHLPEFITDHQYAEYAQPLIAAFDHVLPLILVDNLKSSDIRAICAGTAPLFYHNTPHARCMAAFRLVEKVYPRSLLRDKPSPRKRKSAKSQTRPRAQASYHKPHRTVRLPYKD